MSNTTRVIGKSAIPGGAVAFAMSYALNHSLFWAVLHMLCGWLYVLYWLFSYTNFREWMLQWVVY